MKRQTKLILLAVTVTLCVLAVLLGSMAVLVAKLRPTEIDQITVTGLGFDLRATAFAESGVLSAHSPGGIYTYEYRPATNTTWSRITSFRYSHPDLLPPGQIRVLDDQHAYFFHEFVFGMTDDGGASWAVHGEPAASFNKLHQWRSPRILKVTMASDGAGTMSVEPYRWQQLTSTEFTTSDFGRTWQPVRDP